MAARAKPLVRPALDSDADGIIALVESCWSEYEGCVMDLEVEMAHLRWVASHYAEAGGGAWLAVAPGGASPGGTVVGSVAWNPVGPGTAELHLLYVAGPARHRGLGARLVRLVEATARRRGADRLELWSDTRFLDAHRLYRTLGYEKLPEVRELHDLSHSSEFHFTRSLAR